jgi:hypothetical protein
MENNQIIRVLNCGDLVAKSGKGWSKNAKSFKNSMDILYTI